MIIYVVILLYIDFDSTGEVFFERSAAETYAKRQMAKDDWIQGYTIIERKVKGRQHDRQ